MYEASLSNNKIKKIKTAVTTKSTQTVMLRMWALTVVQGLYWTGYCYSTEQDEHYARIKYNNLYSMRVIFTLLAKKNTYT